MPGVAFNWTAGDSFSIELWMLKIATVTGTGNSEDNEVVVGREAKETGNNMHWWLGVESKDGFARFELGSRNAGNGEFIALNGPRVDDGVWHHVVGVRDGTASRNILYVDGVEVASQSYVYTAGFDSTLATLDIGWVDLGQGYGYTGIVDEVAIHDRILSPSEIKARYYLVRDGMDWPGTIYNARDYTNMCEPVRIMPLGNSITYGNHSGVLQDDNDINPSVFVSYRKQLWDRLYLAGYNADFVGALQAGEATDPNFDPDNAGYPGARDDEIVTMLDRGTPPPTPIGFPYLAGSPVPGDPYLQHYPADVVLLHIGTNGLDISASDVDIILDEIDEFSEDTTVIVTRIINRRCLTDDPPCPESDTTTEFNNNVIDMARMRSEPGYPGYTGGLYGQKDKIIIVNHESGAAPGYTLLNYEYYLENEDPTGDMWDNLHPFETGYEKMAAIWFDALDDFLPVCTTSEISITSLPTTEAFLGQPYRYDVDATGNPIPTYSLLASPAGMDIDETTGMITWIPSTGQIGAYPITVMASNGILPDTTQDFTVKVLESGSYLNDGSRAVQYDFDAPGSTFDWVRFDTGFSALVLDGNNSGSYISPIFDAESVKAWESIAWTANVGELPQDGRSDESFDMHGNVLLYHLNNDGAYGEINGRVFDFSGSGNSGISMGSGISIGGPNPGKFNSGYLADAADDGGHVNAGTSTDFNFASSGGDGYSFFTWFNKSGVCDSPDEDNEVMASRFGVDHYTNTWWLGCGAGGGTFYPNKLVLVFFPADAADEVIIASNSDINDDKWHHGGWVYDPVDGNVSLYLDGALVNSGLTSPDPFTSINPLCIGAYGANCDTYEYVGSLDEVAAFKRSLSDNEVKDLYERGVVALDLSVRVCNDDTCSGEDFISLGPDNPQSMPLNGRYFQYRFGFDTMVTGYTPELYRVAIDYRAAASPDIDGNGVVDGRDLAILTDAFGSSLGQQNFNLACDFDGNDSVDQLDLQTFAGKFGGNI